MLDCYSCGITRTGFAFGALEWAPSDGFQPSMSHDAAAGVSVPPHDDSYSPGDVSSGAADGSRKRSSRCGGATPHSAEQEYDVRFFPNRSYRGVTKVQSCASLRLSDGCHSMSH